MAESIFNPQSFKGILVFVFWFLGYKFQSHLKDQIHTHHNFSYLFHGVTVFYLVGILTNLGLLCYLHKITSSPPSVSSCGLVSSRHHISAVTGGRLSTLILGADSEERAQKWHKVFEKTISAVVSSESQSSTHQGLKKKSIKKPIACSSLLNESDIWLRSSSWLPWKLVAGKQIWQLNTIPNKPVHSNKQNKHHKPASSKEFSILKVHQVADAPPEKALSLLKDCFSDKLTLVEKLSEFSDIVHWTPEAFREVGFPQLDFCVLRQWRTDPDGSMVLTLDSVMHESCPISPKKERGTFHSVSLVVPDFDHRVCIAEGEVNINNNIFSQGKWVPRSGDDTAAVGDMDDADAIEAHAQSVAAAAATAAVATAIPPSCLVIIAASVDAPSLSKQLTLKLAQTSQLLLYILSKLSFSLQRDRYCFDCDNGNDRLNSNDMNGEDTLDMALSPTARNRKRTQSMKTKLDGDGKVDVEMIASTPPCSLPPNQWGNADLSAFVVRGPTFTEDHVKIPACETLFELIAIDMWKVDGPMPNIASHPLNRVAQAHKRGDPSWVCVIQLQMPGPPFFAFVAYFVPKDPTIMQMKESPFGRLAQPFFFGEDDDYRDDHFKLIPKVVEGNFIVKNAVGAKPTILGRKLKQHYFRGPNYFELDVDIGSSAIAQRVVGIAYGYAKLLTVDLTFVLQGESVDELPESAFGALRLVNLDFNSAPFLESPEKAAAKLGSSPPTPPPPANAASTVASLTSTSKDVVGLKSTTSVKVKK